MAKQLPSSSHSSSNGHSSNDLPTKIATRPSSGWRDWVWALVGTVFSVATMLVVDGVVRKYEDIDRRRRSVHLPPNSYDSRKAASLARAKNSGVHRLLRTTSVNSIFHSTLTGSATALTSTNELSNAMFVPDTVHVSSDSEADPESHVPVLASAFNQNSSIPVEQEETVELDGQPWPFVVLKMTSFNDEDVITSFQFDTSGGAIGRGVKNVASVPADKMMLEDRHAFIEYTRGRFFITAGDQVGTSLGASTFIKLPPPPPEVDDMQDKMQWPLDVDVSFRVGTTDFLVTHVSDTKQELTLEALTGPVVGTVFVVPTGGAGIGRAGDNVISITDHELSRRHAEIWFDTLSNSFFLNDLESLNGTFMRLSGPYAGPYLLELGDDLLIGQTCFSVARFDFGVFSNIGARRQMEDAQTVIQDLNIASLSAAGLMPQSFYGVYDGHGGYETSQYVADTLHEHVMEAFYAHEGSVESPEAISKVFVDAFERCDEEYLREGEKPQAGSTATVVCVIGKHLYCINVGDSRTVLSANGIAKRLSNDHKPGRKDEAQRIREMGGFVVNGRVMGELAVSRAFGDAPFKTFEVEEPKSNENWLGEEVKNVDDGCRISEVLNGPLVIATPEVTVKEVEEEDEFVILASDGLFDVFKDQAAVDFVRRKLVELGDVQRAVEALVDHAVKEERSMDNVTACVVLFKRSRELCVQK